MLDPTKRYPAVLRDGLFKSHLKICIAEALLSNHFKLIGFHQTSGRLWRLLDFMYYLSHRPLKHIKFRIYSPYYAFENSFRYLRSL